MSIIKSSDHDFLCFGTKRHKSKPYSREQISNIVIKDRNSFRTTYHYSGERTLLLVNIFGIDAKAI